MMDGTHDIGDPSSLRFPEGFQAIAVFGLLALNAAFFLFGLMFAMGSAMLFAAPNSDRQVGVWLYFAWLNAEPFIAAVAFVYGYRALNRYSPRLMLQACVLTAIAAALPIDTLRHLL